MQKRALIRLLAASAALVLMISVCCVTVFGYEPDTAENTYTNGTVTKDEENPPVEPTPDPTEEPVQTPTPTEKPVPTEKPISTPTPTEKPAPTEKPTQAPTEKPDSTPTVDSTPDSTPTPTYRPMPTPDSDPTWSGNQGGTTSQTQDPQNSSPDFGDDDNSDLVNDGSVISSLPIPGETEESGESGESSEESSSKAAAAGNSGSPLLFFGGIAMIVLGVAGLGTVVYLQFIRPAMAAKKAGSKELFVSEDDDGYTVSQTPADPMSDTAEINLPDDGDDKE